MLFERRHYLPQCRYGSKGRQRLDFKMCLARKLVRCLHFKRTRVAYAIVFPIAVVLPGLTKKLSDKLFPGNDAMGKTIDIADAGPFKVTGILNEFPGKTHFEFEALASFATVPALEEDSVVFQTTSNWTNYYTNYSYIRLKSRSKGRTGRNRTCRN